MLARVSTAISIPSRRPTMPKGPIKRTKKRRRRERSGRKGENGKQKREREREKRIIRRNRFETKKKSIFKVYTPRQRAAPL